MRKTLYPWQKECLNRWLSNGGRGVVNVVTGGGKTLLALAAAEQLRRSLPNLKVYIVAPKTFLASQWARALYEELDVKRQDVGFVSGKRKDPPDRDFMIYVVNSARYTIARHIVSDFRASRPVLLIADECHHYGTSENARIFDFIDFIPDSELYYSLGLSVTPYSANFKTVLVPALGREIYRFGFGDALNEGIINSFNVFNIALSFRPDERDDYEYYTESLSAALRRLKERLPLLRGMSGGSFFTQLKEIRILVSCKALDEGLNVPKADVGVVVSSTNSDRQRIQRLGRVLRKKGEINSRLYYLYIEDTVEETALLHTLSEDAGEIPVIDMTYGKNGGFINPYYDELAESAREYARRNNWSGEKIYEMERNLEPGRIACDWLLTEEECRRRISLAETRAERNYFVTMALLAKAREDRDVNRSSR